MTYPNSSPVSAGQPTAADHYNNLRLDALYLGAPAASATLGALLQRFETGLTLQYLATHRLRVPATTTAPVCLVINGVPCTATANVDLSPSAVPSGAAANWYVFAVDSGSGTFTLSVNTSATEAAGTRLIGGFYWNGSAIDTASIYTANLSYLTASLSAIHAQAAQCRLTLSTGTPVPTSDIATSGTVYLTPYLGNRVGIYGGSRGWALRELTEISASLSAIASGKNADVFLYENASSLALELVEWTNDTTRATNLAAQDGVYVKYGDPSRRFMGTVRTVSSGAACDTLKARFIWNMYNRVLRPFYFFDDTNVWSYTVANTWRQMRGAAANKIEFVRGLNEDPVFASYVCGASCGASTTAYTGWGLDSTSADTSTYTGMFNLSGSTFYNQIFTAYRGFPSPGYHYLAPLERSSTATGVGFIGDNGDASIKLAVVDGWMLA